MEMKVFKGPDFGFNTIVLILCNLLLLQIVFSRPLIYVGAAGFFNIFYYLFYRNDMNYIIVTDDRIIVKNKWRRKFQEEILFKDIKSVGTSKILYTGLHLELESIENKSLRINCSNVGFAKLSLLIDELSKKIPTLALMK